MITFRQRGDFSKLTSYLTKTKDAFRVGILHKYGRAGVAALSSATPVDTGKTAESWYYKIEQNDRTYKLAFYNSNVQNGCSIAIVLQYGHGTANGGWIEGRDYINPAIQPIFDAIANDVWREVTKI